MRLNKKYIGLLLLYVFGVGIVLYTNPQHLSPALLIMPLLVLSVAVFWSLLLATKLFKSSLEKKLSKKTIFGLAIVTAFPAFLLLLQSIGQLSFRDVVTIILILIVLGFYVSKASFGRH